MLSICALILVLHLPLVYYAMSLHAVLQPGQGVADLAPTSIAILVALLVLPYGALTIARIPWNPDRARLNEANT